jgi:hypothetical protein
MAASGVLRRTACTFRTFALIIWIYLVGGLQSTLGLTCFALSNSPRVWTLYFEFGDARNPDVMPSALSVRSNGHQSGISSKINEQGISKEWLQIWKRTHRKGDRMCRIMQNAFCVGIFTGGARAVGALSLGWVRMKWLAAMLLNFMLIRPVKLQEWFCITS